MESVREALTAAGFKIANADIARVPKNTVTLEEKAAIQAIKLLERLDDLDDVSRVTSNADFPASVLESAELAG
jgi:transcriptional/translational regulatory protein YebC/TACO1